MGDRVNLFSETDDAPHRCTLCLGVWGDHPVSDEFCSNMPEGAELSQMWVFPHDADKEHTGMWYWQDMPLENIYAWLNERWDGWRRVVLKGYVTLPGGSRTTITRSIVNPIPPKKKKYARTVSELIDILWTLELEAEVRVEHVREGPEFNVGVETQGTRVVLFPDMRRQTEAMNKHVNSVDWDKVRKSYNEWSQGGES